MDYNKEALLGAKTWDKACLFFVNKDLKATNNLEALSKASIGVANSTVKDAHNRRIKQLQSVCQGLLQKITQ